jgi:hypothetical protein
MATNTITDSDDEPETIILEKKWLAARVSSLWNVHRALTGAVEILDKLAANLDEPKGAALGLITDAIQFRLTTLEIIASELAGMEI